MQIFSTFMLGYESRYARILEKPLSSSDLHLILQLVPDNLQFHSFGNLTLNQDGRNFATVGLLLRENGSDRSNVAVYKVPRAKGLYAMGTIEDIQAENRLDVDYSAHEDLAMVHAQTPQYRNSSSLDQLIRSAIEVYRTSELAFFLFYGNSIFEYRSPAILLEPENGSDGTKTAIFLKPLAMVPFSSETLKEVDDVVVRFNKRKGLIP